MSQSRSADRGPRSVFLTVPNLLTLARMLMIPVFIGASFRARYLVAFIIFVSAAVTDILDGVIARRFNQRSRIGAVLDPLADKGLMISGYLFYTLARTLPLVSIPGWLTFTVFIRDLLIVMFAYLLYTRVRIARFPPSWLGKISTFLQAFTLGTAIGVNAFVPNLLTFAHILFHITLLTTLISGWDYLRRAKKMLLESAPA